MKSTLVLQHKSKTKSLNVIIPKAEQITNGRLWGHSEFYCAVVSVGDVGEVWLPAEDGQSGESLEATLVHPEEWRDPLLQISCECVSLLRLSVCFLLRFCYLHRKHCRNICRTFGVVGLYLKVHTLLYLMVYL